MGGGGGGVGWQGRSRGGGGWEEKKWTRKWKKNWNWIVKKRNWKGVKKILVEIVTNEERKQKL
jgi:hypothetical protein